MRSFAELKSLGLPVVSSASPAAGPQCLLAWPSASSPREGSPGNLRIASQTAPTNGSQVAMTPQQPASAEPTGRGEGGELAALTPAEEGQGSFNVMRSIAHKLRRAQAAFDVLGPHEPCRTSEDAVRVRQAHGWPDTTLRSGAKAMLLVSKDQGAALLVMPADGRLSWKKSRAALPGTKKSSWQLATEEDVASITGGCVPGSVPPFASVFPCDGSGKAVPTFIDRGLEELEFINFNCGLRTRSIRLATREFVRVEAPTVADIVE